MAAFRALSLLGLSLYLTLASEVITKSTADSADKKVTAALSSANAVKASGKVEKAAGQAVKSTAKVEKESKPHYHPYAPPSNDEEDDSGIRSPVMRRDKAGKRNGRKQTFQSDEDEVDYESDDAAAGLAESLKVAVDAAGLSGVEETKTELSIGNTTKDVPEEIVITDDAAIDEELHRALEDKAKEDKAADRSDVPSTCNPVMMLVGPSYARQIADSMISTDLENALYNEYNNLRYDIPSMSRIDQSYYSYCGTIQYVDDTNPSLGILPPQQTCFLNYNLTQEALVMGVVVAGRNDIHASWGTNFTLMYGNTGFDPILDSMNVIPNLGGNVDALGIKTLMLPTPIVARYLTLFPSSISGTTTDPPPSPASAGVGRCCFRADFIGCAHSKALEIQKGPPPTTTPYAPPPCQNGPSPSPGPPVKVGVSNPTPAGQTTSAEPETATISSAALGANETNNSNNSNKSAAPEQFCRGQAVLLMLLSIFGMLRSI